MPDNNTTPVEEIYSPLEANVKHRDYTGLDIDPNVNFGIIPEPVFNKPSTDDLKRGLEAKLNENNEKNGIKSEPAPSATGPNANGPTNHDTSNHGFKAEPKGTANQFVSELDNADKKKASQAVVDAVLDGYTIVNKYANKLVQFNPKKIERLVREGEINDGIVLNVDNQQLPLNEYIESYNYAAQNTLFVSEEFKEKVSPVMLRVFMKRNIGMTDENLLAYYFGMDIIQKGITVGQLRAQQNAILDQLKELTKEMGPKSANANYTAPATNNPPPVAETSKPTPSTPTPPHPSSSSTINEKMEIIGDKGRTYETVADNAQVREFIEPSEPDEMNNNNAPIQDSLFSDAEISDVSKLQVVDENAVTFIKPAMPTFGDKAILADMERKAAKAKSTNKRKVK